MEHIESNNYYVCIFALWMQHKTIMAQMGEIVTSIRIGFHLISDCRIAY